MAYFPLSISQLFWRTSAPMRRPPPVAGWLVKLHGQVVRWVADGLVVAVAANPPPLDFRAKDSHRFLLAETAFAFAATGVPNHFAKNGASSLSGHQSASVKSAVLLLNSHHR
jgi:hypothetical protein